MPLPVTDMGFSSAETLTDNRFILRRYLWWEWRNILLQFAFVCVYLEVCLHLSVFPSLDVRIVFPILFALIAAGIFSILAGSLPRLPNRIVTLLLTIILTLLAEVQLVYFSIFGNFMPISQTRMGGAVVTNFGQQILWGLRKAIVPLLLLLVPLIVTLLIMVLRKSPYLRLRWRQNLSSLGIIAVFVLLTGGLMLFGRNEPFSVHDIFTNVNTSTDISYKNVGMIATTEQELRYMLLGVGRESSLELNDVSLWTTSSPRTYSSMDSNVIESIDFTALAEAADSPELKTLDEYFSTVRPTRKNDYTGLLEGCNLITICAESFSPWLISRELTPTLYEMAHTGIIFENYYGTFQSVTTNGEYTFCMGLYPDMSRSKTDSSFGLTGNHHLPFCLGNALRAKGYSTWAYHNYIGDFYNRNTTHPNMGYIFQSVDNGLNITVDWPSSDLEMIQASVDDYIDSSVPFHVYYMTFSGHYQYNWHNAMSARNRAAVENLPYSAPVQAFIACNLELEYALEYLVDRLEGAGKLDSTCIVLTNDHYPYGLTEEEYNELAGRELDTTFEKYRNSFLCYAPGLDENITVDKYCCTADILPTMLNLMGVDYDSRLLAGTDVLSDGIHIAILSDKSFITNRFRFDVSTETVIPASESDVISDELLKNYRMYVDNKFQMSSGILLNNYYAHVFGRQTSVEQDTGTVVFEDITDIFQQAGVSYMYRNGYIDPESESTFGGKTSATLGELADVFYRIAEKPGTSSRFLPENYGNRKFTSESYPYYDAVCWAFETGLIREEDKRTGFDDRLDYSAICLLISRYAQSVDVPVAVDAETLAAAMDELTSRSEEELRALIWCFEENFLTGSTGDLTQILKRHGDDVNRAQMATFLFRFCTYKLAAYEV